MRRNKSSDERPEATKDSSSKRVNFDNERESKFNKEYEKRSSKPRSKSGNRGKSRNNNSRPPKNGSSNAIAPFLRNPELLESVSRIGVTTIAGETIKTIGNYSTPGVMRLTYASNPLGNDPAVMRQAMNDQYSFVAHANSRNYNYSPEALMTIELAGAEVFSAIALGIRVYGLTQLYSPMSKYLPDVLIEACGFSARDIRENVARMYGDILTLIAKSKQIWLPNTMAYIPRWWKLNSEIYLDTANLKDQYYVCLPAGFRQLHINENGTYSLDWTWYFGNDISRKDGLYGQKNGKLYFTEVNMASTSSENFTWEAYINTVYRMIDALMLMQDRGMIYGDILNAYGAANIFALAPPEFNYQTPILNDMAMLTQIMNCTFACSAPTNIELTPPTVTTPAVLNQKWVTFVKPDSGSTTNQVKMWSLTNFCLNFKTSDIPTSGDIVNATRFISAGLNGVNTLSVKHSVGTGGWINDYTLAQGYSISPATCGSEVMLSMHIYQSMPQTATQYYLYRCDGFVYYGVGYDVTPSVDDQRTMQLFRAQLATFDWRPTRYLFNVHNAGTQSASLMVPLLNPSQFGMAGTFYISDMQDLFIPYTIEMEAENVVQVVGNDLRNMNNACIQSLAGVPISMAISRSSGKNMDKK